MDTAHECRHETPRPGSAGATKTELSLQSDAVAVLRCDECGRAFRYARSLSAHRLRHGNESVYTCKECGQSFGGSRARLLRHIRREHVRPAGLASGAAGECGVCGARVLHLAAHAATHSSARFVCAVCGRAFSKRAHYHAHCATHSLERPFACALCPAAFRKRGNLLQHARTHERRRDAAGRYLPVRPRGAAKRQIEREAARASGRRQAGTCDRACDTADLDGSHGDWSASPVVAGGGDPRPALIDLHSDDSRSPSGAAAAAVTQSPSNDNTQSSPSNRVALPLHLIDIDSHLHGNTWWSPAFVVTDPQWISIATTHSNPLVAGDPRLVIPLWSVVMIGFQSPLATAQSTHSDPLAPGVIYLPMIDSEMLIPGAPVIDSIAIDSVLIDSGDRSVVKTEPIDTTERAGNRAARRGQSGHSGLDLIKDDRISSAAARERWANVECNSVACDTRQADRYAALVAEINARAE